MPALRSSEDYDVTTDGLDGATPPVLMNAAEQNGWRLDWLEGDLWLVSQGQTRVVIFREIAEAMPFFLRRCHPEKFRDA